MRGARCSRTSVALCCGIIPACAGSTPFAQLFFLDGGDHPRMCGEHLSRMSPGCGLPGSSPHVRGARKRQCRGQRRRGIIPACAGSTGCAVCVNGCHRGSSPHVRGAPNRSHPRTPDVGIIPACAGSTIVAQLKKYAWRDHPRMCGEHRHFARHSLILVGSSPHVRGAPYDCLPSRVMIGIIPACAGST